MTSKRGKLLLTTAGSLSNGSRGDSSKSRVELGEPIDETPKGDSKGDACCCDEDRASWMADQVARPLSGGVASSVKLLVSKNSDMRWWGLVIMLLVGGWGKMRVMVR